MLGLFDCIAALALFSLFFYFHPRTLPWETLTVLQGIQIRSWQSKPFKNFKICSDSFQSPQNVNSPVENLAKFTVQYQNIPMLFTSHGHWLSACNFSIQYSTLVARRGRSLFTGSTPSAGQLVVKQPFLYTKWFQAVKHKLLI